MRRGAAARMGVLSLMTKLCIPNETRGSSAGRVNGGAWRPIGRLADGGEPAGVGRRVAPSLVVRGGEIQVTLESVVEFRSRGPSSEGGPQASEAAPPVAGHLASPPAGARARPITADNRAQYDFCSASCFFPALVIA